MIKTGFFNAVNGDRSYNADDMCNFFQGLVEDGVFKNYLEGLEVVVDNINNTATLKSGKCIVGGKYILNTSDITFDIPPNPSSASTRTDCIIAFTDINNRVADFKYIVDKENTNNSSFITNTDTYKFIQLSDVLAHESWVGPGSDLRTFIHFTNVTPEISVRTIELPVADLNYSSLSDTLYADLTLEQYNPENGEIVTAFVNGIELEFIDGTEPNAGPSGYFGITNLEENSNHFFFATLNGGSDDIMFLNKNYNTSQQKIILKFTKTTYS